MSKDYERGVEQASAIYKEVIREYVAENAKLRKLVSNCHGWLAVNCEKGYVIPRNGLDAIEQSMRELGIEVDE